MFLFVSLFVLILPLLPASTLFPYTTLFRSIHRPYFWTSVKNSLIVVVSVVDQAVDRKSTRLNSSHLGISYAVFCLKKKKVGFMGWSNFTATKCAGLI